MRTAIAVFAALSASLVFGFSPSSVSRSNVGTGPDPAHATSSGVRYAYAWGHSLAINADSTPVFAPHVAFSGGIHRNVLFVLAGNNITDCDPNPANFVKASTLYAFDAGTGQPLWHQSTSGPSRCTTSAPAVKGQWVYAPGLDGKVHKYALATGKEYLTGGWPIPYTLDPLREKESAALQISGSYLYATTSSFGDFGHYEGHLTTINLTSGHINVWNSLCSNIHVLLSSNPQSKTYCQQSGSALFGRGEAVTDPISHDVYVVTGNGFWDGKTNWGDSVLKLTPDGSRLLDSFTPKNQAYLAAVDNDLGSTGLAMLPTVIMDGKQYHLAMQGGKGSAGETKSPKVVYLLNRDELGGTPGPGHIGGELQTLDSPGKHHILSAPAVWRDPQGTVMAIYANDNDIQAYEVVTSGSVPQVKVKWDVHIATPSKRAYAGIHTPYPNFTTPVISGNELYAAHDGEIDIYNPENGHELWSSTSVAPKGQLSSNLHWEYPCVAIGMIFMTDESGHVYAYRKG